MTLTLLAVVLAARLLAIVLVARFVAHERDFTIPIWWFRSGHSLKDFISDDVFDELL